MLLLFKILIMLVSFISRLVGTLPWGWHKKRTVKGDQTYDVKYKKRGQNITQITFRLPLKSKLRFKLSWEEDYDRFFKRLRLATELQTGDTEFDQKIYVMGDHPGLRDFLKGNEEMRRLITSLLREFNLEGHVRFIQVDGKYLCATTHFIEQESATGEKLVQLQDAFRELNDHKYSIYNFRDSFTLKATVIEAVLWSLAIFVVVGIVEFFLRDQDRLLYPGVVFKHGLIGGLLAGLTVLFLIYWLMKGSSRGHRIIVESGFLIILAFPVGGMQWLTDINIELDKSAPVVQEGIVADLKLERRLKLGRGSSPSYSYHVKLNIPEKDKYQMSRYLQISQDFFESLKVGDALTLTIGEGKLGYSWIRSIEKKN